MVKPEPESLPVQNRTMYLIFTAEAMDPHIGAASNNCGKIKFRGYSNLVANNICAHVKEISSIWSVKFEKTSKMWKITCTLWMQNISTHFERYFSSRWYEWICNGTHIFRYKCRVPSTWDYKIICPPLFKGLFKVKPIYSPVKIVISKLIWMN